MPSTCPWAEVRQGHPSSKTVALNCSITYYVLVMADLALPAFLPFHVTLTCSSQTLLCFFFKLWLLQSFLHHSVLFWVVSSSSHRMHDQSSSGRKTTSKTIHKFLPLLFVKVLLSLVSFLVAFFVSKGNP